MGVISAADLRAGLPAALHEELFTVLAEGIHVRIERIVSPPGHSTASGEWYGQDRHEWVLVVEGQAGLEVEGEPEIVTLGPGDHLVLPAHLRHRVAWTAPDRVTVWLAVHFR